MKGNAKNILPVPGGYRILVLLLATVTVANAAETREFLFNPLRQETNHFNNSADIVQFIDETEDQFGGAVSYVVWRELFGAIQDSPSSGTKLLTFDNDPTIQDKIVNEYNYDVARIAEEQNADFVIWGVIREVGDTHLIWSYLAVSDDSAGPGLQVSVSIGESGGHDLVAKLPQKQFNFAPLQFDIVQFGKRRWFVRRPGAKVFSQPDTESQSFDSLDVSSHFDSHQISEKWIGYSNAENENRFVELWALDLLPQKVFYRPGARLWQEPRRDADIFRAGSGNTGNVQKMAYVGSNEAKWFQLEIEGQYGWLPAETVVTSQLLPGGYLLAAMIRFQGQNYGRCIDEVNQFIADGRETDNSILAFANELRGAAAIMAAAKSPDLLKSGREWLDRASELTPYDPAAYRLRAVANATKGGSWKRVLGDLDEALRLDRRSEETQELIKSLLEIMSDAEIRSRFRKTEDGLTMAEIENRLRILRRQSLSPLSKEIE